MKIYIASDHMGVDLKKELISYLTSNNLIVEEIPLENSEYDDYPDFAFLVGERVASTKDSLGILICGNGVGMSIAANKVRGIRCVRAVDSDDAFKGKNHNGANVIAIGANLGLDLAKEIVDTFIMTNPATIDRYLRRISKMEKYENGEYNVH